MDEPTPSSSNVPPPLGPLVDVLRAVVERLSEPPFLFVIGISILVALLVFGIISIAPQIDESVQTVLTIIGVAAMVVIGVLALTALIGGIITTKMKMEKEQRPEERRRKRGREERVMSDQSIPPDCAKLKRQLDAARKTLDELDVLAAGIPEMERTATFSRNLTEQREKVAELKRKLDECLEQETQQ
jgi:hypothetical protein